MGWSEAFAGLSQGLEGMVGLYGSFQRREDEQANEQARRAFQERLANREMAYRDRQMKFSEERAAAEDQYRADQLEYQSTRDTVEDQRWQSQFGLQKEQLEVQREENQASRESTQAYRESMLGIQQSQLDIQQREALDRAAAPFLEQAQSLMGSSQMTADPEGTRQAIVELQQQAVAARLQRGHELGVLSDEAVAAINEAKAIAEREGFGTDFIYKAAAGAMTYGNPPPEEAEEPTGGAGSAGNNPKPSMLASPMVEAQTASGDYRGKSGSVYNEQGDQIAGPEESPGEILRHVGMAYREGRIKKNDPEWSQYAEKLLRRYSQEEMDQQYPGLYRYLSQTMSRDGLVPGTLAGIRVPAS